MIDKPMLFLGPTKKGKTSLAVNTFGHQHTYVVQCQNVVEPNLDGAKEVKDLKCIVFDECGWEVVIKNKALFQAGCHMITLCQSRTQVYAKTFFFVPGGHDCVHQQVGG